MTGPRKCKVCSQLVKGHRGPYGVGKCQVAAAEAAVVAAAADEVEGQVVERVENTEEDPIEVSVVDQEDSRDKEAGDKMVEGVVEEVEEQTPAISEAGNANKTFEVNERVETVNDNVMKASEGEVDVKDAEITEETTDGEAVPGGYEDTEDSDDCSGFLPRQPAGPSGSKGTNKTDNTEEAAEEEAAEEEVAEEEAAEEEVAEEEAAEKEVAEEVVEEVAEEEVAEEKAAEGVAAEEETAEKTAEEPKLAKPVASRSSAAEDVRALVRGKTFTICVCEEEVVCDCEGVMEITDELSGGVKLTYMNPLTDYETDFEPTLSFAKTTGWKKSQPDVIRFKFGGVKTTGVKSSKGEVELRASREPEGLVIRARMSLQLGVLALFTGQGFKNPLKFKNIECNLLEKEAGGGEEAEEVDGQTEA